MLTVGDSPKYLGDRCLLTIPMADCWPGVYQPFISSSLGLLATLSSTGVLDPVGGEGHSLIRGVPCSQCGVQSGKYTWAGLTFKRLPMLHHQFLDVSGNQIRFKRRGINSNSFNQILLVVLVVLTGTRAP